VDRCAVFVDAGYLYTEGGKLIGVGPIAPARCFGREPVPSWSGGQRLPVLQAYWYDGARQGIPTAVHQAISAPIDLIDPARSASASVNPEDPDIRW